MNLGNTACLAESECHSNYKLSRDNKLGLNANYVIVSSQTAHHALDYALYRNRK